MRHALKPRHKRLRLEQSVAFNSILVLSEVCMWNTEMFVKIRIESIGFWKICHWPIIKYPNKALQITQDNSPWPPWQKTNSTCCRLKSGEQFFTLLSSDRKSPPLTTADGCAETGMRLSRGACGRARPRSGGSSLRPWSKNRNRGFGVGFTLHTRWFPMPKT